MIAGIIIIGEMLQPTSVPPCWPPACSLPAWLRAHLWLEWVSGRVHARGCRAVPPSRACSPAGHPAPPPPPPLRSAAGVCDAWCAYIIMLAWRPRLQLGGRSCRNWLYSNFVHRHVLKVRRLGNAQTAALGEPGARSGAGGAFGPLR